jgi:hypothetical protein
VQKRERRENEDESQNGGLNGWFFITGGRHPQFASTALLRKGARNKVDGSTRLTAFGHARLDCPIASRGETLVAMKMDWDYFAPARFGRMHASEAIRVELISHPDLETNEVSIAADLASGADSEVRKISSESRSPTREQFRITTQN